MKFRKVNLVYFSPTQTTKKIVEAVASAFGVETVAHDTTLAIGKLEVPTFAADELVIVGAPVYGGRLPAVVEGFYKSLKGNGTPVIPVVVYGNRDFEDALLELCDYLTAGGFSVVSAGAFVAEHSFGPEIAGGRPDAADLAKAKAFGGDAMAKLEAVGAAAELAPVEVSGNHPYKERGPAGGMAPETTDACNKCGICVKNCPMGIIDPEDPKKIDASKCLKCCSCIKKCPMKAKEFTNEKFLGIKNMLATNFSARREPTLF